MTPGAKWSAQSGINDLDLTPDEKLLPVACDDGSLGVWDVATGKVLWWKSPWQSGFAYIYDVSLARDGISLVVCNQRDFALILDTQLGRQIGRVAFQPGRTNVMSAALSPDGSKCVLVDLGGGPFTFDVGTATIRETALTGAWPARYWADGMYAACSSNNSGVQEALRVVAMNGTLAKTDSGKFSHIGHIRAADDGSFLVSGAVEHRGKDQYFVVGVCCRPATGEVKDLWRLPWNEVVNPRTDFDPSHNGSCLHRLQIRLPGDQPADG